MRQTNTPKVGLRAFARHCIGLAALVLAAAAAGHVPLADMEVSLERYSAMRRALQQAVKAHTRQQTLHRA